MSEVEAVLEAPPPLTAREAALADIAEKRRKNPNWDHRRDPTYNGPLPAFIQMMSDAEYDRHMAGVTERRGQQKQSNPVPLQSVEHKEPCGSGPRQPIRAALPFGQRIRDLRRALGWTQRQAAKQIGVSSRSIIRYEQGISSPLQAAPLRALRRLESVHEQWLGDQSMSIARSELPGGPSRGSDGNDCSLTPTSSVHVTRECRKMSSVTKKTDDSGDTLLG